MQAGSCPSGLPASICSARSSGGLLAKTLLLLLLAQKLARVNVQRVGNGLERPGAGATLLFDVVVGGPLKASSCISSVTFTPRKIIRDSIFSCLPSNYHLLSRFQPLCPAIQELVHKVNLSLSSHLRGLVDAGVAVRVHHGGLLDLKQAHFHGPLGGHIIVAALGVADQIAVLTHPTEQPVLPDLHTVLAQQFCQLTYKDALLAGAYSIRKDASGSALQSERPCAPARRGRQSRPTPHQLRAGKLRALCQLLLHLVEGLDVLELPSSALASKAHDQQAEAVAVHEVGC